MTKSSGKQHLDSSASDVLNGPNNSLEEEKSGIHNCSTERSVSPMLGLLSGHSLEEAPNKSRHRSAKSWLKSNDKDQNSLNEVSREEALLILQKQSSSIMRYDYIDISKSCRPRNTTTSTSTSNTSAPSSPEGVSASDHQMSAITKAPSLNELVKAIGGPPHYRSDQSVMEVTCGKPPRCSTTVNSQHEVVPGSKINPEGYSRCLGRCSERVGQIEQINFATTGSKPSGFDTGYRNTRPATMDRKSLGRRYQTERLASGTTTTTATVTPSVENVTESKESGRRNDESESKKSNPTATASDKNKNTTERPKKRKFLSIVIPKDEMSGIKPLSAADTKKMDEALELASSFARLSSNDHGLQTPRTPGIGSTSKESLSSSLDSPRSKWFSFSFRKKSPYEEKKSYVDELNTSSSSGLVTPEGQQAYNSLVAQGSPLDSPKEPPVGTSQVKKSAISGKTMGRLRNSFSESDRTLMSVRDYKRFIRRDRLSLETNSLAESSRHKQLLDNCDSIPRANCSFKAFQNKALRSSDAMDAVKDCHSGEENSAGTLISGTSVITNSDNSVIATLKGITPVNSSQGSIADYNSAVMEEESKLTGVQNYSSATKQGILASRIKKNDSNANYFNQGYTQTPKQVQTLKGTHCEPLVCNFEANANLADDMELQINESCDLLLNVSESGERESSLSMLPEKVERNSLSPQISNDGKDGLPNEKQKLNVAPPPLPPRIPLRQSTVNNPLPRRKFPLPSDPRTTERRATSDLTLSPNKRTMRQTSCHTIGHMKYSDHSIRGKGRWSRLNSSASSTSSSSASGSDQINCSLESTDEVFNTIQYNKTNPANFIEHMYSNRSQLEDNNRFLERHSSTVGKPRRDILERRSEAGRNANIRANDAGDCLWTKRVSSDLPASSDGSRQRMMSSSMRGEEENCDQSDDVTYEDLMEFALEDEHNRLVEMIA